MTLAERLAAAQQESVALYLRRQQIEMQRQQLNAQSMQVDQELVRLDGDIRTLKAVIADAAEVPAGG